MSWFSGKPSIPPITDEEGVIDWMLKYDPKLEGDRQKMTPNGIKMVKEHIQHVLGEYTTGQALKTQTDEYLEYYLKIFLPVMAKASEHGGCPPGLTEVQFEEVAINGGVIGPSIRVLGYFLLKKYGINMMED